MCDVPLDYTRFISGMYTTPSGKNTYVSVRNQDQTSINPPYVMGIEFPLPLAFVISDESLRSAYSAESDEWVYPIYPPGYTCFLSLS